MNQIEPQDRFPTFRRIGRKLLRAAAWLVKAAVVLFVIIIVVDSIASLVLGRRLEAKIRAIKAKGEPVSFAEMEPPKVPDSENAAVVYAKAFSMTSSDEHKREIGPLSDLVNPTKRKENPKLWDEARPVLAKYAGVFPVIEKATSMPKCRFPVNWEAGYQGTFPPFGSLRRLAEMLCAKALFQSKAGDTEGAVHSVELAFKVGESIRNEPSVLSVLVRIAVIKKASSALREVAGQADVSEAQAQRLYDTLDGADLAAGFIAGMKMERVMGMQMFRLVRNDPQFATALLSGDPPQSAPRTLGQRAWTSAGSPMRPLLYADEIVYLEHMNETVDNAGMSWKSYREAQAGMKPADVEPVFPCYAIVSRLTVAAFSRARLSRDDGLAHLAGSQIVLALKAYKSRFGSYPANFADLRSKLGWKIREDPFSGKDFIYKRQGKGFLLYSLGENLKDDGALAWAPKPQPPAKTPAGAAPAPESGPPGVSVGYNPNTTAPPEGYSYKNAIGEWVADIIWRMNR